MLFECLNNEIQTICRNPNQLPDIFFCQSVRKPEPERDLSSITSLVHTYSLAELSFEEWNIDSTKNYFSVCFDVNIVSGPLLHKLKHEIVTA